MGKIVQDLNISRKSLLCIYIQKMGGGKRDRGSSVTASSSSGTKPAVDSTNDRLEKQIAGIFERLHIKDTTEAALNELYEFKVANPTFSFQKYLSDQSPVFKGYIMRGMKRYENKAKAIKPSSPGTSSSYSSSVSSGASDTASEYRRRLEILRGNASTLTKEMNEERPKSSVSSFRDRLAGLKSEAGVNDSYSNRSY